MVLTPRTERSLVSDDVVVRGGLLGFDALSKSVETCHLRHGVHGASVMAKSGATVEEIFASSALLQRYGTLRTSTVGRLTGLGFALEATGAAPHYTLDLGAPLDWAMWELLDTAFGPERPAPEGDL